MEELAAGPMRTGAVGDGDGESVVGPRLRRPDRAQVRLGPVCLEPRMMTQPAQAIYKERAATVETVNAETRTYRGLNRFRVRGLRKVRGVALWSALPHNVVHLARVLIA